MTSRAPSLWLLLLCLSLSPLAMAQVTLDPAESSPGITRGPVKTVVIGLQARRGVDPGLAQALSDIVQGVFAGDRGRVVLGRQDIAQVLGFESERQAAGCDDASCLSEVASALDADRLITGSMDRLGTSYLVVINEFDAKKLLPLGRVERQLAVPEEELVAEVRSAAQDLLRQTSVGGAAFDAPAAVASKPPRARSSHEPNEAELAAYESSLFWNATAGVTKIISGAGCVVLGVPSAALGVFGLTVPTGPSGQITDEDVAFGSCFALTGSVCCLAGVGLVTWGLADFLFPPTPPGSDDDKGTQRRSRDDDDVARLLAHSDTAMAH